MVPKRECLTLELRPSGTELKGPGELHFKTQQTVSDGSSLADGTSSSDQKGAFFFQADIGMNPETTTLQVTARQELAKLPMNWQQREVIASSSEQSKLFDPGG